MFNKQKNKTMKIEITGKGLVLGGTLFLLGAAAGSSKTGRSLREKAENKVKSFFSSKEESRENNGGNNYRQSNNNNNNR